MKIKTTKNNLLNVIVPLSKSLAQKPSNAILENFLFEAENGVLSVSAGELDMFVKMTCKEPVEGEGSVCIPAVLLTNIFKTFPNGEVTIDSGDSLCKVTWEGGFSEMPCFNAKEYPAFVINGGEKEFEIDSDTFVKALDKTIPAVGKDEMRPVMSAVHLECKDGNLDIVSSNTVILVKCSATIESKNDIYANINSRAATFIKGILKEDKVKMALTEKNIVVCCGNTSAYIRLTVGKYPNYATVIPKESKNLLTVKKEELYSAVKRMAVCSGENSHIKFSLDPLGECTISTSNLSAGIAGKDELTEAKYEGEQTEIGFKCEHLLTAIDSISGDILEFGINEPNKAALLTSATDSTKVIIMPSRI